MKTVPKIEHDIYLDVQRYLQKIETEYNVGIIQAIESGSRAWGFTSPDSDYDVRFIYAHTRDWYSQLVEERDVIEIPISDELDIGGWDLRKALQLANKGNAIVQEWMTSPIVYKQSKQFDELHRIVKGAFNPITAFYHYRSMAKKAYSEIQSTKTKKLKRFFYFARASLSAKWILEKGTMPSIQFAELVSALISDTNTLADIALLISQKAKESEASSLQVPHDVNFTFVEMYESLKESEFEQPSNSRYITNDEFRSFLASISIS
jgi:predicted nucleotidyltransferase